MLYQLLDAGFDYATNFRKNPYTHSFYVPTEPTFNIDKLNRWIVLFRDTNASDETFIGSKQDESVTLPRIVTDTNIIYLVPNKEIASYLAYRQKPDISHRMFFYFKAWSNE